MAITATLHGTERVVIEGDGEFLRCSIRFEEDGVQVGDLHPHLIPLHARVWTEAAISAELGRVARDRIEALNLVRSQTLDETKITVAL